MIKNALFLFLIIFIIFLIYYVYIFLRFGTNISIIELFSSIKLFSYLGYRLEPIPARHPWVILMIIYIIGFSSSLINIKSKEEIKINSMIFLLSSLGLGLFMYFLGRTINLNLLAVSLPAIVLMSIYGDLLFKKYHLESLLHEKIFLFIIISFLSLSIVSVGVCWTYKFPNILLEKNYFLNLDEVTSVESNILFIKKHVDKNEKVLILSGNQGVYHSETKTSSIFNVGVTDLFFRRDYLNLINLILSDNIKIFIDKKTYPLIIYPELPKFTFSSGKIKVVDLIENNYKLVDNNDDIFFMISNKI